MQEESIYNLIPKEYVPPPKQPLYKSKYSPNIPPTASTFGHHTTSVPNVSNTRGKLEPIKGPHTSKGDSGTFGKPKGAVKPDPHSFSKKGTGRMGSSYTPSEHTEFRREEEFKKPPVPKKDEKPIYGLVSKKNFILSNKVENMLAQPKLKEEEFDYTKKTEYGKTPEYLKEIKNEMNREYEHIKALHQQEEDEAAQDKFMMSAEEINILREGLKKKWELVNKDYQQITHISKITTVGLKRRKEDCEKELAQLQKDIEKLNKAYIIVDTTQ